MLTILLSIIILNICKKFFISNYVCLNHEFLFKGDEKTVESVHYEMLETTRTMPGIRT